MLSSQLNECCLPDICSLLICHSGVPAYVSVVLFVPSPASLCGLRRSRISRATSEPHTPPQQLPAIYDLISVPHTVWRPFTHILRVMTPQKPLSAREFSHLPSTSEESEGSIVGKRGNFRGGVRGDGWFLQWLVFILLVIWG